MSNILDSNINLFPSEPTQLNLFKNNEYDGKSLKFIGDAFKYRKDTDSGIMTH